MSLSAADLEINLMQRGYLHLHPLGCMLKHAHA